MQYLAGIIALFFGLYLVSLLIITSINRNRVVSYISSFASTVRAHFVEQLLRLIIGIALVVFSSEMLASWYVSFLGWILIGTSIILIIIPWKVHHRFGKWAIPLVIRHIWVYAALSAALGITILISIIYPIIT